MKVFFFGTPEFVVPVLNSLNEKHEVVGVVTTPDAKSGRQQVITPTPVKKYALEHNLPIFSPAQLDTTTEAQLTALRPDFLVVAAYGQIIPQEILDIPSIAALNIHPSLLPKYRGPSPIQETILQGEHETGVTIIKMDAETDHGPIVAQEKVVLTGTETFLSLADELFRKGAEILLEVMSKPLQPREQNHKEATFTNHITKQDGFIDTQNPFSKEQIDRMIRAYHPWPGVYFRSNIKDEKSKLIKLLPEGKMQMEGKNPVTIKDFLNGYPQLREVINRILDTRS